MASSVTNAGRLAAVKAFVKAASPVTTSFKVVLIRVASGTPTPNVDWGLFSDWTTGLFEEIPAGNGYTSGGITLERSNVGWPDADDLEDDTNDRGVCLAKDLVFTASGGPIPATGAGATFALLTDDNATLSARKVYAFWDLGGAQSAGDGGNITIQDAPIRGVTPA